MTMTWKRAKDAHAKRIQWCKRMFDILDLLETLGCPPPDEVNAGDAVWTFDHDPRSSPERRAGDVHPGARDDMNGCYFSVRRQDGTKVPFPVKNASELRPVAEKFVAELKASIYEWEHTV